MKYQGGDVDEAAVKAAGGEVLAGGNGVRVGGWVISSHKGPITADAELDRIKNDLGTLAVPEQFYGENYLQLVHEASGTAVSFSALDALKGWLADKSEAVHVGEAEEWLRSRQQDVQAHAAQTVQYDWTYTTSFAGAVCRAGSASDGGSSSGTSAPAAAQHPPAGAAQPTAAAAAAAAGDGSAASSAAAAAIPQWRECRETIPRALLTARDPIIYFDDLALYESELDDHGSSRCSVKVRVMPRCWYVLLRFWLRVDHVMVRLREARLFCQFAGSCAAPRILREVRYQEGTFVELRAAGAPAEGPAYADADSAAAALMAVAPVGVKLYRQEHLELPLKQ